MKAHILSLVLIMITMQVSAEESKVLFQCREAGVTILQTGFQISARFDQFHDMLNYSSVKLGGLSLEGGNEAKQNSWGQAKNSNRDLNFNYLSENRNVVKSITPAKIAIAFDLSDPSVGGKEPRNYQSRELPYVLTHMPHMGQSYGLRTSNLTESTMLSSSSELSHFNYIQLRISISDGKNGREYTVETKLNVKIMEDGSANCSM